MYFCLHPSVVNITAHAKSGITRKGRDTHVVVLCLRCSSCMFCAMCWSCIWLWEAENLLIASRFARRTAGKDAYHAVLCHVMVFYDLSLGVRVAHENRITKRQHFRRKPAIERREAF